MEKENDIVVFTKCENAIDANIIKGLLEDNGIIAGVMEENLSRGLMMSPTCVMVMRRDLDRARNIVDAVSPAENLPPADISD